jgi:hypothetical protein
MSNHEFGNGIKGQFRWFARQDITDIEQNVRRGHGGKVFVKGKHRHVGVGFLCDFVLSKFIS